MFRTNFGRSKKGIVHIAKIEPIINNISEYSEKEFKAFSDIELKFTKIFDKRLFIHSKIKINIWL